MRYRPTTRRRTLLLTDALILVVRAYRRVVSPLFPACCRYTPTCSQYTLDALARHGLAKGCVLGIARVLRCNPWVQGGHDPVPE